MIGKTAKRFAGVLLVISLILISGVGTTVKAEDVNGEIQKIYCTATLADEFSDNVVLIALMPAYNFDKYSPESFPEINCTEVKDLWSHTTAGTVSS